jgi:metal-responsive CopG/Arc/MetJ family transcriptional regulator
MPEENSTTPLLTKRVNLFLDENLYSRLNEAAWTTRVSMSEFIRQAIKEKLGESEG